MSASQPARRFNRALPPRARTRCHPAACGYAVLGRVVFIHERLGNGRLANAPGLARELGVTARTIKRDVEFMRSQLGAPIEWEPSTRTYFYSRECDILPLLRLEADEALALVLAGRTFAAWRGSPLGRALTNALGKIAGVTGGAVSVPADTLRDFIFQPEAAPAVEAEHRFFAVALEAIRRRRELLIDYQKPGTRASDQRTIHPLHLAFIDHRWMLIAHDSARCAPRNFLLTRMRAARPTGERFTPPAGFDLQAYLRGSLGRFTGDGDHVVRIAFDAAVASYVREDPWHSSQLVTEGGGGGLEITLRLNNLIDVARRVLACGSHAEALAPEALRETIRTEAAAMLARYRGGPSLDGVPSPSPVRETYSQGRSVSPPPK